MRKPRSSGIDRSPWRPTVQDVADYAGVSTATVSRVLNGVASVDASLVERVHAARDALRYRPNRAARALAGGRSAIIGMLVTDSQNPYFSVLHGSRLGRRRCHAAWLFAGVVQLEMKIATRERQYVDSLAAESVAGVLIVPTTEQKGALHVLIDNGIPVVAVDRRVRDSRVDAVLIDNVAVAREAVCHLIDNGYRRIGIITGPARITTARERLDGYHLALRDAGINPSSELERHGPFTEESGRHGAQALLELQPALEALLAANNRLAKGALEVIHARGLRVPDDIALVGFDDMPWMGPGSVSLTTVTQPAYELGSAAALRLIQRLKHRQGLARQEIVLAHHLRVGDSSRARATSPLPLHLAARPA